MGLVIIPSKVCVENFDEQSHIEGPISRREETSIEILNNIRYGNWTHLVQDNDSWRALMKMVTKLRIPKQAQNFLIMLATT
jgi:hypothetical protein